MTAMLVDKTKGSVNQHGYYMCLLDLQGLVANHLLNISCCLANEIVMKTEIRQGHGVG